MRWLFRGKITANRMSIFLVRMFWSVSLLDSSNQRGSLESAHECPPFVCMQLMMEMVLNKGMKIEINRQCQISSKTKGTQEAPNRLFP